MNIKSIKPGATAELNLFFQIFLNMSNILIVTAFYMILINFDKLRYL